MSTGAAISTGLYSRLSGSATLTALLASGASSIFLAQAGKKEPLAYVVFSLYAGGPLNRTPGNERELLYFVRGYAATVAAAQAIDAQISTLLHRSTITVTGYTVYGIQREQDLELVETPETGEPVCMAGGIYRIFLDA